MTGKGRAAGRNQDPSSAFLADGLIPLLCVFCVWSKVGSFTPHLHRLVVVMIDGTYVV